MASKTELAIGEVRDATGGKWPAKLPLGEVHLWQRRLDATPGEVSVCYELLSAEERERAQRFRVEPPRTAFVLTRGTLRSVLAHYLGGKAQALRFRYESQGKPFLEGDDNLFFNVSHTDGLAMLAFARGRRLGVDVEKIHPGTEVEKLAERFFSERECRDLRLLNGDELRAAFFRIWTRKEAYIKATGEGLSLPLDQFDVSIAAGDRDALRATRPDALEVERWAVSDITVAAEYAAALAVAVGV